jgi:23S rRNA (uracil1939-C5)-methyltransferase
VATGRSTVVTVSGDTLRAGAVTEIEVHGFSSQGSGVGRLPDGRTVFVPRTAPGDRVSVRLGRVRARWAEAELIEVVDAAPMRRPALCTRYDVCGGCQLQHVPEEEQRAWKGRFVSDALERIGGFEAMEPPEVVASPSAVGYRNRMSFTLRRLRGGRIVAGLHALGRPTHVVEIDDECVLPEPEIGAAWTALRRGWGAGASRLPAGGRLRLTLRLDEARRVALVVEGGAAPWNPEPLLDRVDELSAIVHRPSEGDEDEGRAGPDDVRLGFEQVNEGAARLLREHVVGLAAGVRRVVDAFSGGGAYGRALALDGAEVVGIELDPDAVAEARREAPPTLQTRQGAVEEILPSVLPTELLIVNPPRAGLGPDIVQAVLAQPPERMIYVSCDPATLARDLAGLKGRYEIADLRCFDLFPQTAHVETVVDLHLPRSD